jgi:hypothetical protein
MTRPRSAPSSISVAGILAALAAAWSLVVFARSLDTFAMAAAADGYRPAELTVTEVADADTAPLVEGTIDGHPEAIRLADLGAGTAPSRLAAGQAVRVLFNRGLPFLSLNGRDLRVVAFDPGFAATQRERARRLAAIAYGPVIVLLAVAVARRRARGLPVKGVITAPALFLGFQVLLAAFFGAVVAIDAIESGGTAPPAWTSTLLAVATWRGTGLAFLVLVSAAVALVRARRGRLRRLGLARAATSLQLSFAPAWDTPALPAGFDLFAHAGQFENWIRGDYAGTAVCVVDYSYASRRYPTAQTVAVFGPGAWSGPSFQLEPPREAIPGRPPVTPPEIALDETPFSDAYCVRAEDADAPAVRAVFSPAVMDFFATRPGWEVEARETTLLVYRRGEIVAPAEVGTFLGRCDELRQALRSWS